LPIGLARSYGGGAYAAISWVINLNSGSSAEGQADTIQNLTVTAVSSPAPTNELYPGGTGDVVLAISNPNPYPVIVTGVDLPTNTTYADGYTTAALSTTQTVVSPRHRATLSGTSPHPLRAARTRTTAATVGASGNANNPLTVTLTNDAPTTAAVPTTRPSTALSH
jgi:hypothetical protein